MESPNFEECLPPRDRGRARIDVIRLKTKNAKLFGGRRRWKCLLSGLVDE
jgi:hypothetical protein